ncbi:hypothetical protein AZI87_05160 [Bdellovibrio bacteriovorus]|uniref:DUF4097 domain-containing protein n=1 Tax=Bdellovibrio bacteriovorus TaxID=959 RepID=A0A161PUL8_BDEBC|nr:DUF4097 family beta strand repeat-containing protein [Bdellovibrio bacteriovorus]KYG68626.1 hypothetical protein AZI87_05160 [Bdellovibrio bacteriovorus]
MKSLGLFGKFFIAFTIWTVACLSLATYAGSKAYEQDPTLLSKIEDNYNVRIHVGGISKADAGWEETKDTWNFAPPVKKVSFKSINATVSFKKGIGENIIVSATGRLDKSKAPRLLKTEVQADEIIIQQPEDEATSELDVRIEVPPSLAKNIDIVTVNGNVVMENTLTDELAIKTVAGDVILKQIQTQSIALHSVSADIKAEDISAQKVTGKSVSGDLEVSTLTPAEVAFTSISGDVKIKMAPSDKLRFSLKSVSGEIHNSHGSNKNGNIGVSVSTTSGDIEIE